MNVLNIHHWRDSLLRGLLAFEHWWTRKGPPQLLGIVRIVLGSWLLFYWIIKVKTVPTVFSTKGVVFATYPSLMPESWYPLLNTPSPAVAYTLFWILILSLSLVTIGWHTRTAAFVAFLVFAFFYYLSLHHFHTSFDRLYMFSLLVLSISEADAAFSYTVKQQLGSFFAWRDTVSVLPQRLLAVQLTATYTGVGWQKLWLPGWQGGEMFWYTFMGVWATPLAFKFVQMGWSNFWHFWVEAVKFLEITMPFFFWIRAHNIRWIAIINVAIFHILTDLMLYIWWFAVLVPAFIVFFSPEEITKAIEKYAPGKLQQYR